MQKDERGRRLLQDLGQSARRYDEDTWIKSLVLNNIVRYNRFGNIENFIISDLRFKNEANNIEKYIRDNIDLKDLNIITIRINGENYSNRKDSNDISETDLDDYEHFKYIINNNSTVEHVYNQVDMIMNNEGFKKVVIPELC